MFIDSHCHLNHARNEKSPAEIVQAAKDAHVDGLLTICCRISEELDQLKSIANDNNNVWCSIGTHPHDAGQAGEKAIPQDEIVALANDDPNIIGIGESGLDYYYDNSARADQEESFRKHIRACIETDLPLIVHTRDAEEDTIRIMEEEGAGTRLKGVMHCFSSNRKLAEWSLDFGFYISFSGIVTFKKALELQDIARDVPLEKMLIETDAPFLAPMPHRGKTNEPALISHTAEFLAELKGISTEEIARITKNNFFTLFDKANPS